MKHLLFIIFTSLLTSNIFSQTGPGGVGSSDGSSDLELWLDVNTVTSTDGATVTSWSDQSGNTHNFTAGNGAVYDSNSVNGYPSFSFNGTSHYFQRAYTAALSAGPFSVFTVTNVTSSGFYKAVVSNRDDPAGSATAGFILYAIPTSNRWSFWTGRASGAWQQTGNTTSTAGAWASQALTYTSGTNGKSLYINNSLDQTSTQTMTANTSRPYRIGAGQNETTPNFYFSGNIAEVIQYDVVVNNAQQIIIENYLSAKYNFTLSSEDIYDEDDGTAGNYDHDVAGIGRVDASNLHDDAQGTGIVRILNPSGLGNDEFLIWGHDNGVQQATETTDVPSPVQARFNRVWRASEVNSSSTAVDVGSIDVRFDVTGLGAVTASDLRLLVDTDNDGVFNDETPIGGATALGGNVYQFAGVTAIANNLRFTLGTINTTQTPLPIELISFIAKPIDDRFVEIIWQTASEMNNDYFTIERSKDGTSWEELTQIKGAGNSNTVMSYSTLDKHPLARISYYRLKQTDFDGQFKYSQIRSVNIQQLVNSQIEVYPNPATNQIIIKGSSNELENITLYNTLGQNVTLLAKQVIANENQLIIDISKLNTGMYYLKTKTTANKVYKQ